MKVSVKRYLLLIAAASSVILAGCPLPFEYNGKGAGSHSSDPSSPNMTSPVTVSYSEEGGGSGSIPDGGTFASGKTTTVTLSTASLNAVIFYTDDGTTLSDLRSAKKIDASSGSFTVTRTTTPQSLDIHAVAVGPNMLPSPLVHFAVDVTPYPILTVSRNNASISEDGGTATFTITSSSTSASDIAVNISTSGSGLGEVTGFPVSPVTLPALSTSTSFTITAHQDANGVDETVSLTIEPDSAMPATYSVGASSSAAVLIVDDNKPVLTITAGPTPISDNGGTAVFTVTSSFVPTSDLAVNLVTGGSYKPGDVTGTPALPSQGSSFVLTLPAGQSSVTQTIAAHPDPGEYLNQAVTITLVASPTYTIGGPGAASVTITDTSPVGTLTLSADRSTMTNAQTATFTVSTSAAPDANLTVNLSSSGYAAGKVFVPTNVTILSGSTSAQFSVTAPTAAGYEVQNPVVSLASGTGYVVGSPGSRGLQISDATLGVFNYDGVWGFNSGSGSAVGGGASWNLGGNVSVGSGGLNIGGNYSTDTATVPLTSGSVVFDQNRFTIGIKFVMSDLSVSRPIFVGGTGWRWIMVNSSTSGNLSVDLKNHANTVALPGMTIATGTSYTLVLNVDVGAGTLTAWLNGVSVSPGLPGGFTWDPAQPPDATLTASDYSNGRMFAGTWDWAFAANGLLDYNSVVSLTAAVAP